MSVETETRSGPKTFAQYQLENQVGLQAQPKKSRCKVGKQQQKMELPKATIEKIHRPGIQELTRAINTKSFVERQLLQLKETIFNLKEKLIGIQKNLKGIEEFSLRKELHDADHHYDHLSDFFKEYHEKIRIQKETIQIVSKYTKIETELYPVISAIHRISEEKLINNQKQFDEKLNEAKSCIDSIGISLKEVAAELDLIKPMLDAMDHELYIKSHPDQYNINLFGSYWGEKVRYSPKDLQFFEVKKPELKMSAAVETVVANEAK